MESWDANVTLREIGPLGARRIAMLPEPDQESLLSIFLMEAWDTVAAIEEGLDRLEDPGGVAAEAVYPLVVVAHRLKGSSSLHGFPRLAELGGAVEQILERLPEAPLPARRRAVKFLEELGPFLKRLFDGIGATGREPADAIALFQASHPEVFAPSVAEGVPLPAAPPPPAPASLASLPEEGSERLFRELDRFFAENQDVLAYFGPEADEHLETISSSLLALDQGGRNEAELASLFRAVHTLKGAAYTVGCAPVGDLAHRMEDLLAAVREDRIALGPPVIEAVFAGLDGLRLLLSIAEGQPVYRPGVLERARETMQTLLAAGPAPAAPAPAAEAPAEGEPAVVGAPGAPAGPTPRPGALAPREPAEAGPRVRVSLDRLDSLMSLVGELVISRTRLEQRLLQLQRVDEQLRFSLKRMSQTVEGFEAKHEYTLLLGGLPAPSENGRRAEPPALGIEGIAEPRPIAELFAELEFDRYDDFNILARSVAEISADLVEVQHQSTGLVRTIREEMAQVQRLTGRLRNEITRARMVPLQTLFGRIPRQVREAARAAGTSVNLEVSGEAVEVDTAILEQIADPLLHLVQNAITHGIEPEAQRRLQGKPPQGTLRLHAYPQGGFIYLEVADDGRGIDAALLRREAVFQGFLSARAAALSDEEVLNLIFLPGFSTAPRVTAAAGRGVGLDVVRTNVNRLNGEVSVETELGVGTRFAIKLPLTVVISEALLMRVGGETLAVLMHAVKLILRLRPEEILPASGGRWETIRAEGQRLDFVRLGPLLELPEPAASRAVPVVVLRAGGRSFAVAVDELLGKEEIVIKPLGPFLEEVGPFAGATVSGEGRVILLVDPGRLLEARQAAAGGAPWVGARAALPVAPAGARRPPDAARRVLLADDSISVRKFVGQMLERAGFQVITASDGAEALQILRETPVHALVTDLEMPRLSGFELIENLQRRPDLRELPVVILTTRVAEKHRALAQRLGIEHYVTKPVEEGRFVRLVASLAAPAAEAAVGGAAR